MAKILFVIAGINGFLTVVIGAFGAHGLKGSISDQLMSAFQTGVQYQMFHTLAILVLAVFLSQHAYSSRLFIFSGFIWLAGMILFSGSLYGLALGGPTWLGPITPLGGLLLILGWLSLAVGAWLFQMRDE